MQVIHSAWAYMSGSILQEVIFLNHNVKEMTYDENWSHLMDILLVPVAEMVDSGKGVYFGKVCQSVIFLQQDRYSKNGFARF